LKNFKKPYNAMSEQEQAEEIEATKKAADNLVREAVKIIASGGRKSIVGVLESVTIKDQIKAVMIVGKQDEQRHALSDSTGQTVMVIVADADEFGGERKPDVPTPDQSTLLEDAKALKSKNKNI